MLPPIVYILAGKAVFRATVALEEGAKAATPWFKKQVAKAREAAVSRRPQPVDLAPAKMISLVGRTSAGKSSLGNALLGRTVFTVGMQHGTTSDIRAVPFHPGYQLQDTPGLLDGETYNAVVFDAAMTSTLVVLVTTGQLYRQELDFLRKLCTAQRHWNGLRGTQPARSTVIFVNASDVKEHTMPASVQATELTALREQVQDWIPGDYVLTGAAAPSDGRSPKTAALEQHLNRFFQFAA